MEKVNGKARYDGLTFGHCMYPRLKFRELDKSCQYWEPQGKE